MLEISALRHVYTKEDVKESLALSDEDSHIASTSGVSSEIGQLADKNIPSMNRRRKRSAAWWLAASIRLCDRYPHTCGQIVVQDGDVQMTIDIRDE